MNVVEKIARLIEEPSVSAVVPEHDTSNLRIAELYGDWLDGLGFHVELQEVDGHHTNGDRPPLPKRNVIGTLGRGEGGLVLAGHLDTVPYDATRWKTDPFTLTEVDGALVGLGVADMKAFFALALAAIERVGPTRIRRPLIVVGTADEESGMDGAKALVKRGHLSDRARARSVVIGEPTALVPVRAHKGVAMERLTLIGRSGHSSDPSLGRSALEGMRAAMDAIAQVRAELAAERVDPAFRPPVPTINLGSIAGGDNPNRICASCELTFDVRLLPGLSDDDVHTRIERAVRSALSGSELEISLERLHEAIPAFQTPATAELVSIVERLTGVPATTAAFGTEAPFFSALAGETVVLGPGDIEVAHQPGERLPMHRLEPTISLLERLILERCCA